MPRHTTPITAETFLLTVLGYQRVMDYHMKRDKPSWADLPGFFGCTVLRYCGDFRQVPRIKSLGSSKFGDAVSYPLSEGDPLFGEDLSCYTHFLDTRYIGWDMAKEDLASLVQKAFQSAKISLREAVFSSQEPERGERVILALYENHGANIHFQITNERSSAIPGKRKIKKTFGVSNKIGIYYTTRCYVSLDDALADSVNRSVESFILQMRRLFPNLDSVKTDPF